MGPVSFATGGGVSVPPHPHLGLQTVTWLFEGAALHRDSLGSEQLIRPGQLNLMTAGAGIAHSEEDPGEGADRIHGMQLWVVQPDDTRWGEPAFEHHADLPGADLGTGTASVLIGAFGGAVSSARRDTDHVGVELDLRPGTTVLPLDPAYEHALIVAEGSPAVVDGTAGGATVAPGRLAYLATGVEELVLRSATRTVALLIGGVPFDDEVVMWWNFVARSREELSGAYRGWAAGDDRFGPVSSALDRVAVAPPPWLGTA
jgi:redox-sensitive bicupin YhaK (pirin superfamily)